MLIKTIEALLPQELGRREEFELWVDRRGLRPNEPLTDQIVQAVDSADVLLAILSPGYVASAWCDKERDEFLRAVRERGRSGVFVVEKQPVDQTSKPQEFRDLVGLTFWKKKEEGGTVPLGFPTPDPKNLERSADYYVKVKDLCEGLAEVLKPPSGPMPEPVRESVAVTVFLAPVSYDLEDQWESIRRYLDQAGVKVLPESVHSYTLEPEPFRKAAEEHLSKCGLFVQLLSEIPFNEPPDSTDYAQLQVKLAQSLGKPILQWRHPQTRLSRVKDESQRLLLDAETVRAESIEDFKQEVGRRAFEKPPVSPPEPIMAYVLVDTAARDAPLASQVGHVLAKYGAAVVVLEAPEEDAPEAGADPQNVRVELEENFKNCNALIVIYGQSLSSWVMAQYQQWRKSKAIRKRPPNALALFDGPPETKGQVLLPDARVVDCRKGFDELKLKQFLDEVQLGAPQ